MSYELVPLGDLGEIVTGSTPDTTNKDYWDGNIPWITPADLTNHEGIYFTGNLRKITEAGYKSCSTKMIPAGSIVYSTRAPIGHCAVTSFPLCTNQGFKSIVPNERLDAVYGFFALKYFTPQLEALGRGATFAEVNKETFENFRIPLPPLEEQKRIASLLARADRLRGLRRAARRLADSLLQSVFLEMFGDPRTNPKGWQVEKVGKHIKNIRYGTGSPPDYFEKGIPFIRATNVKQGTIKPQGMVYISEEVAKNISKCQIKAGDLIVVRSGINSGDCALIPPEYDGAYAAYDLIVEVPFPTNHFLNTVINSPFGKETIATLSRRAGQPHVNSEQIESMEYPFPPLPLQEEFARVVARVEAMRARQAEAERQAEGLFQSLLALSFAEGLAQSFGE